MRRLVATLATLPLIAGASACAQPAPVLPDGPVVDLADILPPDEEAKLDKRLRDFFDGNCIAIVMASVTSLEGQPIETYANRLARTWRIGDPVSQQGMLVLVAPNERRVRIEISNPVNKVITNAIAKEEIEQDMTPRYRAGQISSGTLQGVDALIERLNASRDSDGLDRTSCKQAKVSA